MDGETFDDLVKRLTAARLADPRGRDQELASSPRLVRSGSPGSASLRRLLPPGYGVQLPRSLPPCSRVDRRPVPHVTATGRPVPYGRTSPGRTRPAGSAARQESIMDL